MNVDRRPNQPPSLEEIAAAARQAAINEFPYKRGSILQTDEPHDTIVGGVFQKCPSRQFRVGQTEVVFRQLSEDSTETEAWASLKCTNNKCNRTGRVLQNGDHEIYPLTI